MRFCPVSFRLRSLPSGAASSAAAIAEKSVEESPPTLLALPHRWVYVVVAHDAAVLYDTQQPEPVAVLNNLHYSAFTDAAWSADAAVLVLASRDGYCSLVRFAPGELGEPVPAVQAAVPPATAAAAAMDTEAAVSAPAATASAAAEPITDPPPLAAAPAAVGSDATVAQALAAPGPPPAKQRKRVTPQLVSPNV